jgi:hypothetical protein
LCDEMRAANLSIERRRALLGEIKDLLNMMKGEATMLRLRAVAEVLTTAEGLVSRIDEAKRGVLVPRGVQSLFSDLAGLNASGASIGALDLNAHRIRLAAPDDARALVSDGSDPDDGSPSSQN